MTNEPRNRLLVSELERIFGVVSHGRWMDINTPITKMEVLEFLNTNPTLPALASGYCCKFGNDGDKTEDDFRREHLVRIAWLIRNPHTWEPIFLDENQFSTVTLEDGHHRVYAAVFTGQRTIDVEYSGNWKSFRESFPTSYRHGLFRLRYMNT